MQFYSIHWNRLSFDKYRKFSPVINVQVTFLDSQGEEHELVRQYQQWIGICTNHIDNVVKKICKHFPGHTIHYEQLGQAKKILPYFEDRLKKNKLDYIDKPFYKLYTTAVHQDVGKFLNCYKVSYYDDWLTQLYIDFCTKYNTHAFYYKWYKVVENETNLMDSLIMLDSITESPPWTIGVFDIETVPMDGATNRIPNGIDPSDRIVMISICKWNKLSGIRNYLLYLLPDNTENFNYSNGYSYTSEKKLLNDFHKIIEDCQILTGYNINDFDFPCIFARLMWLQMDYLLAEYSSKYVGEVLLTTYQNKLVVDVYNYIRTYSNYDLPTYKLDDVAKIKLGETKVAANATDIWNFYTGRKAPHPFRLYLDYCLKDSQLVLALVEKEDILDFLVQRANFTAKGLENALYVGNSKFLLELFKAYGTRLGFFFNQNFFSNPIDETKFSSMFPPKRKRYQGALNYCISGKAYENVSIMDFTSMYPSALLNANLCYGSCTIMTREEYEPYKNRFACIPYRIHDDTDFEKDRFGSSDKFSYPSVEEKDQFVIVTNTKVKAFLPCVVQHFIKLRKHHQEEYKRTKNVYHHNVQLCIKILINSLYGVMANKDSCLSYIVIAMSIVTLSRYQLLGSFHFLKRLGFNVCYADTDSLMVVDWPTDECNRVNEYLSLRHVELKYEQLVKRLLVISKKRYIYETEKEKIVTKGFQKKINDLLKYASNRIIKSVWRSVFYHKENKPSDGWILWVQILQEADYMCRDARKYSIYRKTKRLEDYKSKSCATYRILEQYPEKANDYIEYIYSRADISKKEANKWIMKAEDCQQVDFEKLLTSQIKIFTTILNIGFWKTEKPEKMCKMIFNTIRWKKFMHVELKHYYTTGKRLNMAVERSVRYTFCINDHFDRKGTMVYEKRNKKNLLAECNDHDSSWESEDEKDFVCSTIKQMLCMHYNYNAGKNNNDKSLKEISNGGSLETDIESD